jgi:hypothetical protein
LEDADWPRRAEVSACEARLLLEDADAKENEKEETARRGGSAVEKRF